MPITTLRAHLNASYANLKLKGLWLIKRAGDGGPDYLGEKEYVHHPDEALIFGSKAAAVEYAVSFATPGEYGVLDAEQELQLELSIEDGPDGGFEVDFGVCRRASGDKAKSDTLKGIVASMVKRHEKGIKERQKDRAAADTDLTRCLKEEEKSHKSRLAEIRREHALEVKGLHDEIDDAERQIDALEALLDVKPAKAPKAKKAKAKKKPAKVAPKRASLKKAASRKRK